MKNVLRFLTVVIRGELSVIAEGQQLLEHHVGS